MKKYIYLLSLIFCNQALSQELTSDKSGGKDCAIITSNEQINYYVDRLMKIEEINEKYNLNLYFDDQRSIESWVAKKFDSMTKEQRSQEIAQSWKWLNRCAIELKDTKYLWMFTGIEYQKMPYKNRKNLQEYINTIYLRKNPSRQELDAEGNIVFIQKEGKIQNIFESFSTRSYGNNTHSALFALYLGGDLPVKNIGEIVGNNIDGVVRYERAKIAKEKQNADAYQARSKFLKPKLLQGDFSAVKDCFEIIENIPTDQSLSATISPHKNLKATVVQLTSFGGATTNGYGSIRNENQFARIETSKGTMWFEQEGITINSNILVVGWYKDNVKIRLTNGSSQQAPLIDAVCIQPQIFIGNRSSDNGISKPLVEIPELGSNIVDKAHYLTDKEISSLQNQLIDLETKTGTKVVILTVFATNGETIEDFSTRARKKWNLEGKLSKNSLLFALSINDRRVRISTTESLRTRIPDAIASEIISRYLVPSFKNEDYFDGFRNGISKISSILNEAKQ